MIRIYNPHHVPFLHQTEQLRQAGTLCDTLLTVEGLSFKAHALILALASKRLGRQLTNQHNPNPGYCCAIESVSPHTLKQILDYVYSESVEVPKDDLEELLRGAEYLEVESLVEQCQAHLKNPTKTNVKSPQDDKTHKYTQMSKKDHCTEENKLDCSSEERSSINKDRKRQTHSSPKKTCSPVSPVSPIFSRETIISSGAPSQTPRLCWPPVNPNRSMVLNCSEIMAFHSLRAYPYPTPMYPILHRSLQPQVSSSLMGYTGLLHPYHSLIHSSPLTQDSPFTPGVKGKSGSISASLAGSMTEDRESLMTNFSDIRELFIVTDLLLFCGDLWAGSGEMAFRCKFCGRGGRDRRSLRSLRRAVGGEKPYQCKQCSKRFSLKHQLDTHHRVHTGEKPFECRLCGQRSRDYSAMIKHLRTHSGATPYQCTLCLEFCSSLAAMQKHLKNHPTQEFPPDWSLSSTYLYNCHT
ncbi:zinc finger and BTB domain-containing protein 32 [Danio aesculapii]|uniref:zinc finger and BTB domain-containing protein 32 n=1 Tax=Danio aesculapii TaxID=1142201 RepID=UPI0024C05314|nr:zinc finger and BTB domain-containing protein 32 [Danio aesculapii]